MLQLADELLVVSIPCRYPNESHGEHRTDHRLDAASVVKNRTQAATIAQATMVKT